MNCLLDALARDLAKGASFQFLGICLRTLCPLLPPRPDNKYINEKNMTGIFFRARWTFYCYEKRLNFDIDLAKNWGKIWKLTTKLAPTRICGFFDMQQFPNRKTPCHRTKKKQDGLDHAIGQSRRL